MGRIKSKGKKHLIAVDEDIWNILDEASSLIDMHVTQYVKKLVIDHVKTPSKPGHVSKVPLNEDDEF